MSFYSTSNNAVFNDGFIKLNQELLDLSKMADESRMKKAREAGAEYLVNKVRQLSKPRRKGKLLSGMTYESKESETDVGWNVYYGRLKEKGHRAGKRTSRSKKNTSKDTRTYVEAISHLHPTYQNNKEEIYRIMIKELKGE